MIIIPDFMAVVDSLRFTIGNITWTTGLNSLTTRTMEEAQIQSMFTTSFLTSTVASTMLDTALTTLATSLTTPTTHRSLPRYKGKQVDLKLFDQVDLKLFEILTLVDLVLNQSIGPTSTGHHRSTRPTQVIQPEWLDIYLMIITT
jgi:hypothetical protein